MSNGRTGRRIVIVVSAVALVIGVIGFAVAVVLNFAVFSDSDAYGEVAVPGSASLELPAGEVAISYHGTKASSNSQGVFVPDLKLSVTGSDGVPVTDINDTAGSSSWSGTDVTVEIGTVQIPKAGTYNVVVDGAVNQDREPRVSFGYSSPYWWWVAPPAVLFGVALAVLVTSVLFWKGGDDSEPVPPYVGPPAYEPAPDQGNLGS